MDRREILPLDPDGPTPRIRVAEPISEKALAHAAALRAKLPSLWQTYRSTRHSLEWLSTDCYRGLEAAGVFGPKERKTREELARCGVIELACDHAWSRQREAMLQLIELRRDVRTSEGFLPYTTPIERYLTE